LGAEPDANLTNGLSPERWPSARALTSAARRGFQARFLAPERHVWTLPMTRRVSKTTSKTFAAKSGATL
jgi:hypothetical protein